MDYIYAGVTTDSKKLNLFWRFAQKLVGKGKFIHCFLGFEDNGRQLIYHSTANRSHVMLRSSFLLERVVVAEWALPVAPDLHRRFIDACFADSGLVPYGHVQNVSLGAIKLWNRLVGRGWLRCLRRTTNPFGSGTRKQNCSERAGRRLEEFFTGNHFVQKDGDLYAPDDFVDDCFGYEAATTGVLRVAWDERLEHV